MKCPLCNKKMTKMLMATYCLTLGCLVWFRKWNGRWFNGHFDDITDTLAQEVKV